MAWRRWGAAIVLALGAVLLPLPASAGVDDFSFRSLDAEYHLTRAEDGTSRMEVTETFVAEFPASDQNHGMKREIPDTFHGVPLFVDVLSVTDEHGSPRDFTEDSDDGFLVVTSRTDGYVHGAQTYVFRYTVQNPVRFYSETGTEEFYWNVNGLGWPQPFGRVSMTLSVDPSLLSALTGNLACYSGPARSTTPCPIGRDGDRVTASAENLRAQENMTVAVGFASGTFRAFDTSYGGSALAPWQLATLVGSGGVLVWGVVVRRRVLRDEPGHPVVVPQYEPPAGIDALHAAVLLGKPNKAFAAEVLEQAVRGSLRIVEVGKTLTGKPKLAAELVDPGRVGDDDGRDVLDAIFGRGAQPGTRYRFDKGDATKVTNAMSRLVKQAGRDFTRLGLRKSVPLAARVWPMAVAGVFAVAAFVLGFVMTARGVISGFAVMLGSVALVVAAITVLLLVRRPLTHRGASARDHLTGLRTFMEWAEADRIRMLQSVEGAERVPIDTNDPVQMLRLYEPLLPYAVVFGIEKSWANRLTSYYSSTGMLPYWYLGTGAFDASSFSAGVSALTSASTSVSSASSGGSTGGGFSGGGGGGGGGGGV